MPVDDHFELAKVAWDIRYFQSPYSRVIPSREGIGMQGNLQIPTNLQLSD